MIERYAVVRGKREHGILCPQTAWAEFAGELAHAHQKERGSSKHEILRMCLLAYQVSGVN